MRSCFGRRLAAIVSIGLVLWGVSLLGSADALATISGANGQDRLQGRHRHLHDEPERHGRSPLDQQLRHLFPDWSPDGTRIAFHDGDGISTMNADGSGRKTLTRFLGGIFGGPSWSPDGQRIAFARSGGVYVVNADGSGAPTQLSFGADSSPDLRTATGLRSSGITPPEIGRSSASTPTAPTRRR